MSQIEKVESKLADDGVTGESVRHAALAFRAGGARKAMIGGAAAIAGAAGAAVVAAVSKGSGADAGRESLPLPERCVVALTDQRLLVFSVGGVLHAGPKELLYDYTFDQISWVGKPEPQPGPAQAVRVEIGLAKESVLCVEFPKLSVDEGRELLDGLRGALPPAA